MKNALTIKRVTRRGWNREAKRYDTWTEYHVLEGEGGKVLGRFATRARALKFIAALNSPTDGEGR